MNPQRPDNAPNNDEDWAISETLQRKIDENIGLMEEMTLIARRYPENSRLHSALTKIEKIQKELQYEVEQMKVVNRRDQGGHSRMVDKGVYMF